MEENNKVLKPCVNEIAPNNFTINVPEGFNVKVFDDHIELVKEKRFPNTHVKCCEVLGLSEVDMCNNSKYANKLHTLNNLLTCRDAYWKLENNWKPDWSDVEDYKYAIYFLNGEIKFGIFTIGTHLFVFPSEEMMYEFYDNFSFMFEDIIEILI